MIGYVINYYLEDVSWKENNVILSDAFNMHIFGVWWDLYIMCNDQP